MTAIPAPVTRHLQDPVLEKRFIVGSLALECSTDLAETARQLLEVPDSTAACARFTADFRRLFFGDAESTASPGQP